jgi:type II secretion system protein N
VGALEADRQGDRQEGGEDVIALPQLPQIPPHLRRPARNVGWVLFTIVIALVTMYASLPRDRIKDRIEATLSADPMSGRPGALGMDATIGDLSLTLFTGAGLKARDVVLRSRPVNPNDKPARYTIDEVTVHVGLLGLLFNRPTYTFKAHLLQGTVSGEISLNPSEERIKIDASGLVLSSLPSISQSVGLPVEGTLSLKVDAVAAKGLAQNLDGTAELSLEGAVIGDGKAKLTVPGDPFLSQGVTFPKLRLGNLNGRVTMAKGRANIDDFRVHSADGDATLEGYVDLRDPLAQSTMHGFLKFRPAEALLKREPTVELMSSALASAKRPDGFIGFQLSGPLSAVFYLPNQNPPPGVTSKGGPAGTAVTPPPAGAPRIPPPLPSTAPPPPPVEPEGNEPPPAAAASPTPPAPTPSTQQAPIPVGGSPAATSAAPTSPPPAPPVRGMAPHGPIPPVVEDSREREPPAPAPVPERGE